MNRDTIVIGTSVGGVEALRVIAAALPREFNAVVLMVLHVGAHRSMLPNLLGLAGPLLASHPRDRDPLIPGRIYVAPPTIT